MIATGWRRLQGTAPRHDRRQSRPQRTCPGRGEHSLADVSCHLRLESPAGGYLGQLYPKVEANGKGADGVSQSRFLDDSWGVLSPEIP